MDSVSSAMVASASSANLGTVQGVASVSVLKKALDLQASSAAQLIQTLPQSAPATTGSIGTQLDTYA